MAESITELGGYQITKYTNHSYGRGRDESTTSHIGVVEIATGRIVAAYDRVAYFRDVRCEADVNGRRIYKSVRNSMPIRTIFRERVLSEFGIDIGR